MIRKLISSSFVAVWTALLSGGMAPDDDGAPPKSNAKAFKRAEPSRKAVVGTEVVPAPAATMPIKVWGVNQVGAPPPRWYPMMIPSIENVACCTNGRWRVTYGILNRGNSAEDLYFDFRSFYLADPTGESYRPVAWEFPLNGEGAKGFKLLPGSKQKFYLDFDLPPQPVQELKVGIVLQDRNMHPVDTFKVFKVKLPVPFWAGMLEADDPAEAGVAPPGAVAGEKTRSNPGEPSTRGGAPAAPASPSGPSSPRQVEELAEKFRSLSEEGRWLEGDLFVSQGKYRDQVKIAFKKRDEGEFVEATIVSLSGANRKFETHGAFFRNLRSPSGLALKLRDCSKKVEITLILDGNNLKGKDSDENQYSFILPKR